MFENIVYCRTENVTRWITGAGMCIACWGMDELFSGEVFDEYNRFTRVY